MPGDLPTLPAKHLNNATASPPVPENCTVNPMAIKKRNSLSINDLCFYGPGGILRFEERALHIPIPHPTPFPRECTTDILSTQN